MKTFKQFNQELSWSTRIYVLLAISLTAGAFLLNAWSSNFALTIALSLALVLLVEALVLSTQHHPRTWQVIGWLLLFLLCWLFLTGFF